MQVLSGLGGVGKTQLAVEYAYSAASAYDVVWWVRAEEPAVLFADYALLAGQLGLPECAVTEREVVVAAVRHWLEQHGGWLLIFDNASEPAALRDFLPRSPTGHVLVTSQNLNWRAVAHTLDVREFARAESCGFLQRRTLQPDDATADALAEALGDLPLALAQAAAYIEATGMTLAAYLALFHDRRQALWQREEPPWEYRHTVATTWGLAMERLEQEAPQSMELLHFCAYLGPEAIPYALMRNATAHLPPALVATVTDPLRWPETLRFLRRYALVATTDDALSLHRLVQAVVRDRLGDEAQKTWASMAVRVLSDAFPRHWDDVQQWPPYARLLPHALAAAEHAQAKQVALDTTGDLLNHAGAYLQERAQYDKAEELFQQALALVDHPLGADPLRVATCLYHLASLYRDQGKYAAAVPLCQRAHTLHAQHLEPLHPEVATSLDLLGALYHTQGKYTEAMPLLQRALAIREQYYGLDHLDVARTLHHLASLFQTQGHYAEAELRLQRALAIAEQCRGPADPFVAACRNNVAGLFRTQGRYPEAVEYYQRALTIAEQVLGPASPEVAVCLNNLGSLYHTQGRYTDAALLLQRARSIAEQVLGADHLLAATCLHHLALLNQMLGKYTDAARLHQQALVITETALGPEHPDVAQDLTALAALYHTQGQYAEATQLFQRALTMLKNMLGSEHPQVAWSLHGLGVLASTQGQYGKARNLCQRALTMLEQALGPDHPDVTPILASLAALDATEGQYAAAVTRAQRALTITTQTFGTAHPAVTPHLLTNGARSLKTNGTSFQA